MRLWHEDLLNKIPRQQLLGQHRECCALRGKGWGKSHSTVNYVFENKPAKLVAYHFVVMSEMRKRGYNPNDKWMNSEYRGKKLGDDFEFCRLLIVEELLEKDRVIYDEHNEAYLKECVENLDGKGCVCRFLDENLE